MSTHAFIVICSALSAIIALYTVIPYAKSIVKGRSKPHQFSWLIFTIMSGITLVSQVLAGARASAVLFFVFFINELIILILSLKYGVRGTSQFDKLLLGLALCTIVVWVISRSNALTIWLTVLIDIFATTMIVLKVRRHPGSEAPWPWFLATVACVFSCLTLVHTHFGILYVRPYYALLSDGAIALAAIWFRSNTPTESNSSSVPEKVI